MLRIHLNVMIVEMNSFNSREDALQVSIMPIMMIRFVFMLIITLQSQCGRTAAMNADYIPRQML